MGERRRMHPDMNLSVTELQTVAPLVRLLSAALWKVMKQRDVMQYGVLEKFVTSACETVPGMLTFRHQGKLTLGLRGRLILELCRTQPDAEVIEPHLQRMRAPTAHSSIAAGVMNDVKIAKTVESFHLLVHTLLNDNTERELFFKEDFPVDYGPMFDKELEKLLWEFLSRMDRLLSVPSLNETLSWLTDIPVVLEECACSGRQPQLLSILICHETRFGHLDSAAALPPNMRDCILESLSLSPSGKTAGDQITGRKTSASCSHTPTRGRFISPITGQISPKIHHAEENEETQKHDRVEGGAGVSTEEEEEEEEVHIYRRSGGMKRKHSYTLRNVSMEAEKDDQNVSRSRKRLFRKVRQSSRSQVTNMSDDDGTQTCSVTRSKAEPSSPEQQGNTSSSQPSTQLNTSSQTENTDCSSPGTVDKENNPIMSSMSSCLAPMTHTGTLRLSGDDSGQDYVADSEDEATKNFKCRLFMKRYHKTKHGTYIPTLREYWKPTMQRRDRLSVRSKH